MPINFVAVVIAAIANMVIGMLWYGPLFGKRWIALMQIKPQDTAKTKEKGKKSMQKSMALGFVGALVMSYVLAYLISLTGSASASAGAMIGFWAWLGFVATVTAGSVLWEGKPKDLYFLNVFHYLVSMLVMGAIIGAWV